MTDIYKNEKARQSILLDVLNERLRQMRKFGEQKHPDGDPEDSDIEMVRAKYVCDARTREGRVSWRDILEEEVAEAIYEIGRDPKKLRKELVEVAAVCAAWIEDLDGR